MTANILREYFVGDRTDEGCPISPIDGYEYHREELCIGYIELDGIETLVTIAVRKTQ